MRVNGRLAIGLLFLVAVALPSMASASNPCGSVPSSQNSLTLYCIPITVASSSATSNAQVMLTFNALAYQSYLSGSLQNIYVYNSISGNTIPAWIEGNILNEQQTTSLNTASNVIIWLNDPNANIISTSADTNYYIGVGGTGTDFFVSGNNIGEAPQLSSSYAEYDNGNSVFNFYDNFSGTTLSSKWTVVTSGQTVNNGMSQSSNSGAMIYSANSVYTFNPQNMIIETYAYDTPALGTDANDGFLSIFQPSTAYHTYVSGGYFLDDYDGAGSSTAISTTASNTVPSVWSIWYASASEGQAMVNYGTPISLSTDIPAITSANIQLSVENKVAKAGTQYFTWVRSRIYPPSGVMPATTFGAAVTNGGSSGSATLSISANPITYGQSVTISATCSAGDSCAVDYPSLGTAIATGTGSASYSIPAFGWAAGTYSSFYANDITAAVNSVGQSLTINKNSSYSVSLTYRGAAVVNGQAFNNNLNASGYLIGNVATHNSQLSAKLEYNVASPAVCSSTTGCSYNSVWNDKNNWANWSAGNTNYTSRYINISIDYVPYVVVSSPSISSTNYETATDVFSTTINVTKYATTANGILEANGVVVDSDSESVTQGPQAYQYTYRIPLLEQNKTAYVFNSIISLLLQNGTTISPKYSSLSQTELFNYYPALSVVKPNIIQGENNTLDLSVAQKETLNEANVSSNVIIGNQSVSWHVAGQYSYYANLYSFINSRYDLTMPSVNSPVTVTATVPVELSLGTQSVWRNQSTTFDTYLESLVSCSSGSTNTIHWNFYNASSPASAWNGNVLFTGSFQVFDQLYQSNTIPGTSAGLSANAIANTYTTCIYPSFAQFQASGSFVYSGVNTSKANYYLQRLPVSNSSQNIDLYLETLSNPILYEVAVENVSANQYIAALVQELLYDSNTNSSVLVDEFYTQAGSGTYTYLNNQAQYKFIAYTPNYPTKLLAVTNYLPAAPCSSTACPYVIQVGNFSVSLISSVLKNMNYSCSVTPGAKSTAAVSCSFTSFNGTSYNTSLVLRNSTSGILNTTVCTKSIVTASGSLSCTAPHTNNTQYYYTFSVYIPKYGWYGLAQGSFGTKPLAYGEDGVLLALLIVIGAALLFITKNPTWAIIMFSLAFTVINFIGLINMGVSIGFMWVGAAILIYIINRR